MMRRAPAPGHLLAALCGFAATLCPGLELLVPPSGDERGAEETYPDVRLHGIFSPLELKTNREIIS